MRQTQCNSEILPNTTNAFHTQSRCAVKGHWYTTLDFHSTKAAKNNCTDLNKPEVSQVSKENRKERKSIYVALF